MKEKRFHFMEFLVIIMTILFVFCLIRLFESKAVYEYDATQVINAGTNRAVLIDNISMKPGVYQVELEYEQNSDYEYFCTVEDSVFGEKYLLTSGSILFSGLSKTGYKFTLLKSTDSLRIIMQGSGEETVKIGRLVIRNTNQMYSILAVFIIALTIFVVICHYFIQYAKKENYIVAAGILVISYLASVPYLGEGLMWGSDMTYHMLRIQGVYEGVLAGHFPVRLEPGWLHGYGYADGIFYCNAMFLLPGLLRIAGFTINFSYKVFNILLNVFTAWLSYYSYSKIFKNKYIGLFTSALYTLSIYRIYKFFVRFHIGEAMALTWMPLIIYGFYRVFTEEPQDKKYKNAWIPLAIGLAGLIQTHILSCEIAATLIILTCLIFIKKVFIKETFIELTKAAIAAILFSLWYLVPFLDYYINEDVHIKHVSDRTIQEYGLIFDNFFIHFWGNGGGMKPAEVGTANSEPMGLGLLLFVAFVSFGVFWVIRYFGREKRKELAVGKVSWCFTGMLCVMTLHVFPWDRIQYMSEFFKPFVSSLQYPVRFLGWGTAFCVCMIGSLMWFFYEHKKRIGYICCCMGVLLAVFTSSMHLINHLCETYTPTYVYNIEGVGYGYLSGAEYLIEGTDTSNMYYDEPKASKQVTLESWEKGSLEIILKTSSIEGGYIDIPLLKYKGYHAFTIEDKSEIQMTYGENNVIRLIIPENFNNTIKVKFISPFYWRIAEIISYISIIGFCLYYKKIKQINN